MHICPRCGYTTDSLYNFKKHLFKRKEICELAENANNDLFEYTKQQLSNPEKNYKCEHCCKSFATRSGLAYHKKQCKKNSVIEKMQDEIESLRQKVELLEHLQNDKVSNSQPTNNITITGDNNVSNVNNITVNINTFGKENKDYITLEFARQCFEMGGYGIQRMLDIIYFDNNNPDNHNVRMKSLKNSLVEVMKDGKWEVRGLNDTIDTMINNSSTHIMANVGDMYTKNPTSDNIANAYAITNIQPEKRKRIRERTKSKLVDRREKSKVK